ncbi:MAG: CpsB/CapC family capsule biosynthesis tyrosine phosphatase [Bacillota bacterium]|nr:CpsB/CapC family capsule biosynthesis tyrosine phosphatase [Bacillota bacterium]
MTRSNQQYICDLHSHILPGVDDGSVSLEESLAMIAMAADSGVGAMVATPHSNHWNGYENYWSEDLAADFETLRIAVKEAGIPVEIFQGMEIFVTEEAGRLLSQGAVIPLAQTRYLLTEFAFDDYPNRIVYYLDEFLSMGYVPIVAHPERYYCVQDQPGFVRDWMERGCLMQLNKGSFLGRFGRRAAMAARELTYRRLVTAVASDAHHADFRTPSMFDLKKLLQMEFSEEAAEILLMENPRRILQNQSPEDMLEPLF